MRRALRAVLLGGAAAVAIIAVPVPAFASTGSSPVPLRLPLPVTIELPISLPALPLSLGHQVVPVIHRQSTHRAIRLIADPPSPAVATKGPGQVAVTAPGLISVVPIGPLPSALRPRVATESVRAAARSGGTGAATSVPAPPVGFWFALVLLVLLFGSASYLIGDRRRYSVAVSITNR